MAENLHKYAKYLKLQNEKMLSLQHADSPARDVQDAISLFTLPKQGRITQAVLETLSPVYRALANKELYEAVCLNELMPIDSRQRYHFIQLLKATGCPGEAMLYTYSTGNNKGNYHFVWLIPSGGSSDDLQSRNASVVHTLNENMPQFHSRAMKRNFVRLFGSVANVQPVYLREIYRQLTGDTSAASSDCEKKIDERLRLALDSEDPDIVIDLRQHNKGTPSKYDQFWQACEQYIQNTVETAVDDRRHDRIAHLASLRMICCQKYPNW